MEVLTVEKLYKECKKQIEKGNGKKVIMISDDDEGNGYHYLWYTFYENTEELLKTVPTMIDERISDESNTIILG